MEGSAAETLDQAREGANVLVLATLDRLREAGDEVMAGNFVKGQERVREAAMKLQPLAQAESLTMFAGNYLTRANLVTEGVTLANLGTVMSREDGEIGVGGHPCHVQLEFDNGQRATYEWDCELLAVGDGHPA